MKIWVIGRGYPTKSNKMKGSFEIEQAKMLSKYGHQVSYIAVTFHPINKVKKWGYCNFKDEKVNIYSQSVIYTPERVHLHLKSFQHKIWRNLLKHAEAEEGVPDIIHVHYPAMVTIPEAVLAYQKKGTRIVLTEHWTKTLNNTMDSFQRDQLKKFVDSADATICVGTPLKNSVLKITGTKKEIRVVPNIVSPFFHYISNNVQSNIYNFVTVGRLVPVKQIDKIVIGFAQAFSGKRNIFLTIIGDGAEKKKIDKVIHDYNIESQVKMLGTLSREETADIVAKSDSLICYSRLETFGVPVIEAWACGKPVIGSNSLGMLDLWSEELGYIVHDDNMDELKQAMIQIYKERNKYNPKKIAEFANKTFGEKAVYKQLFSIYNEANE